MPNNPTDRDYARLFTGLDVTVPLLNGDRRRYTNLDNAASTPALVSARDAVNEYLNYYSSVHRGTGFKSQISTHLYEESRHIVMRFLGADPHVHTCIYGKNTTEAVNKLARRYPFRPERDIVLTTGMEHHSNDLPWRAAARVIHVGLTPTGSLDESDFDEQLERYGDRVALVAVTGASNVTGILNPVHELAEKAHAAGARIFVDCAQLAPHRAIDMRSKDDPSHLDYVAISAHKLYAPFGTGALVGLRETFETGDPDLTGGGTVEIVTLDDVVWADPPDREEAGSPNTVGAIALAAAICQLERVGMQSVAGHEANLTEYALKKLSKIEGIKIFGDDDGDHAAERLGVLPFKLEGFSHFLVAAILGYEFGIGVRSGCFCAHPYILHLLGLSSDEARGVRERMLAGDRSDMPGLVRVSFGLYNSLEDVEALCEALERIVRGEYSGEYVQDPASGEYEPEGWDPDYEQYFSFDMTNHEGQEES